MEHPVLVVLLEVDFVVECHGQCSGLIGFESRHFNKNNRQFEQMEDLDMFDDQF
jgi:hypothetical protein